MASKPVAAPTTDVVRVGRAGDGFEREADRAADAIVDGRDVGELGRAPRRVQRACATCATGTTCATCEDEELVQREATGSAEGGAIDSASAAKVDAVRGASGERMPRALEQELGMRFGRDLSHVRVHHDGAAASAARAVSARAFTLGHHIAFEPGAYKPGTPGGMRLLAHELAHVVQQDPTLRRSPVEPSRGRPLASADRAAFEPRFGSSLAHVRVHEDAYAQSAARTFGAAAFTYGHHIVLGAGAQVHGPQRRRTLAHELAHVLQYRGTAAADRIEVGATEAPAEREADAAATRVLAGRDASVTPHDDAPVVRRAIPAKHCENTDHEILILQWMVHIARLREVIKDHKYDRARKVLSRNLDVAEALIDGYQKCGRINAPATSMLGLVTSTPTIVPNVPPPFFPEMPPVEPAIPEVAPPAVEIPPGEAPSGMTGGGTWGGVAISVGAATIQWLIGRALSPSPSGEEITIDDLKDVMREIDAQLAKIQAEIDAAPKVDAKPAAQTAPKVDASPATDVDEDEEPEDEPKSCNVKDQTCKQVPIPRKGGDSKFARRHNRCADSVTIPAYKGRDVCINGKAFDAVDSEGTLWEIKAHAWSYAKIYQDPKMAARIAKDIASSIYDELLIARACGKKFKVGVRDPKLKTAIRRYLPGLKIEVLKC